MQNKVYDLKIVRQKIEYFCAYQERCQSEVIDKLKKLGVSRSTSEIILSELIQNNFVDEQRYAISYASGKFRMKAWGKYKISQNLSQKGISDYCIQKALNEIDYDEYLAVTKALCEKKMAQLKSKSHSKFELIQKLKSYMFRKGYEPDIFNQFIIID